MRFYSLLKHKPSAHRGIALVEVLIAAALFALGLLAIVHLQIQTLRYDEGAFMRNQAVLLAGDIFDRMRANPATATAANNFATTSSITAANCISTNCTPAQMATFDLSQWAQNIQTYLPAGSATIINIGNNTYTVAITWQEVRGQNDKTATTAALTESFQVSAKVS